VILVSDNGASGRRPGGSVQRERFATAYPDDMKSTSPSLDEWAGRGPTTITRMAGRMGQHAVQDGEAGKNSRRTPLTGICSWPAAKYGSHRRGERRHQIHLAIDIVPTILDSLGVEPPRRSRACPSRIERRRMRYSVDDPGAFSPGNGSHSMLGYGGSADGLEGGTTHPPQRLERLQRRPKGGVHTDTARAERMTWPPSSRGKIREW